MAGHPNKAVIINRIGTKVNSLTAVKFLGYAPNTSKQVWLLKCDCGGTKEVRWANFIRGFPQTCGCRHGKTKHDFAPNHRTGKKRAPIYLAWINLRQRCNNPNSPDYPYYGGRGIKVCERWTTFENFLEDMGKDYYAHKKRFSSTTIDRIDVNGDYTPDNCRWATRKTQSVNRRPWLQNGKRTHV